MSSISDLRFAFIVPGRTNDGHRLIGKSQPDDQFCVKCFRSDPADPIRVKSIFDGSPTCRSHGWMIFNERNRSGMFFSYNHRTDCLLRWGGGCCIVLLINYRGIQPDGIPLFTACFSPLTAFISIAVTAYVIFKLQTCNGWGWPCGVYREGFAR